MLNRGLDKLELLRIVEAVANEKSIDKELVIGSMESAIQKAALTKFGNDNNIEVIIDRDTGDIKIKKVDLDNTSDTDNSFSTLSASICSNNSFLSFSIDEITYANMYNFPVQLNCIEMLDKTLDNYLEENNG